MKTEKHVFDFKRLLSFKGIAAILIFGSWVTQNFLFNKFSGYATQIQTYSIKRDSYLTLSTTWWIKFIELKNYENATNKEKILTLTNFLKYSYNLIEQDIDSIGEFKERKSIEDGLKHHKQKLNDHIVGFFDFSDLFEGAEPGNLIQMSVMDVNNKIQIDEIKSIDALVHDVEEYMIWSEFAGKPITEHLNNSYNTIKGKSAKYNYMFLCLYIVGAFIGGLGFMHKKIENKTKN